MRSDGVASGSAGSSAQTQVCGGSEQPRQYLSSPVHFYVLNLQAMNKHPAIANCGMHALPGFGGDSVIQQRGKSAAADSRPTCSSSGSGWRVESSSSDHSAPGAHMLSRAARVGHRRPPALQIRIPKCEARTRRLAQLRLGTVPRRAVRSCLLKASRAASSYPPGAC